MGQNLKRLLQELDDLAKFFSDLKELMFQATKDLNEFEVPPSQVLIEYLATSRRQFEELRATVVQIAKPLLASTPPHEQIFSLQELKSLLESVMQAEQQKAESEKIRADAVNILDRVLAIAPHNHKDFPPLQQCHLQACQLRSLIVDSQWPHVHPDTERLATQEHPFAALLKIVERKSNEDYSTYTHLQKIVAESFPGFGEDLAVAALMGVFFISEQSIPENPLSSVTQGSDYSVYKYTQSVDEKTPLIAIDAANSFEEFLTEITFEVPSEPAIAQSENLVETPSTSPELNESKPDRNNPQYLLQINRNQEKVSLRFIDP